MGQSLNYAQKNAGLNEFDEETLERDRRTGDVSLLKGDKYGKASVSRVDGGITLYGDTNVIGRIAYLSLPKSCSYPKGWDNYDIGNG